MDFEIDKICKMQLVNYSPEEYGKVLFEIQPKEFWCSTDTDYDPDKKGIEGKIILEALKRENKR